MAGYYRRAEYTRSERENIIKYIIEHKQYYGLKGRALWKEMEKDGVCKRTWQSMKEHFRTKIIPELQYFNMQKEERQKILSAFQGKTCKGKRPLNVRYMLSDSDEENSDVQNLNRNRNPERSTATTVKKQSELLTEHTFTSSSDEDIIDHNVGAIKLSRAKKRRLSTSSAVSEHSVCLLDQQFDLQVNNNKQKIPNTTCGNKMTVTSNIDESCDEESDLENTILLNRNDPSSENSDSDKYCIQDDEKIITYFNKYRAKLKHWKDLETYALMKSACGEMRYSPKSLQERFMKHILPNLRQYTILSQDDMIDIYDITGSELPIELKVLIYERATKCIPEELTPCINAEKAINTSNVEKREESRINVISIDRLTNKSQTPESSNNNLRTSSESEEATDANVYTRENEPFSSREDYQMVELCRKYRKLLENDQNQVFQLLSYIFKRQKKSIQNRIDNHILPHITDFVNLSVGDMLEFYMNAGKDVPNNLKSFLEKICTIAKQHVETHEIGVQASEQFYDLCARDFVCIRYNDTNIAFISDKAKEIDVIKSNLEDECNVPRQFMYVIDDEEYQLVKGLKEVEIGFKSSLTYIIDNYLLPGKMIDNNVYEDICKSSHSVLMSMLDLTKKNIPTVLTDVISICNNSSANDNSVEISPTVTDISSVNEIVLQNIDASAEDNAQTDEDEISANSTNKSATTGTTTNSSINNSSTKNNTAITNETSSATEEPEDTGDTIFINLINVRNNLSNKLPDATNYTHSNNKILFVNNDLSNRCGPYDAKSERASERILEDCQVNDKKSDVACSSTTQEPKAVKTENFDDVPATPQVQNILLSRRAKEVLEKERINVAHLQPHNLSPLNANIKEEVTEQSEIKQEISSSNQNFNILNVETVIKTEEWDAVETSTNIQLSETVRGTGDQISVYVVQVTNSPANSEYSSTSSDKSTPGDNCISEKEIISEHNYFLR